MGFAETFRALSDPVRRSILELLKGGCMSAGEIVSHFDITGATISYHLRVLKQADLVSERKEKNFIYYELNASVLEEIMLWIADLKGESENETNKGEQRISDTYEPGYADSDAGRDIALEAVAGSGGDTF